MNYVIVTILSLSIFQNMFSEFTMTLEQKELLAEYAAALHSQVKIPGIEVKEPTVLKPLHYFDQALYDPMLYSFWLANLAAAWEGNSNIAQARVILLGEKHDEDNCYRDMSTIIAGLAKGEDIVLTEGLESLQPLPSQLRKDITIRHIPLWLPVYGWDAMKENIETEKLLAQRNQWKNKLTEEIRGDPVDSDAVTRILKKLVAICRKEGKLRAIRNKKLIETIDYFLDIEKQQGIRRRVFVFAGQYHYDEQFFQALKERNIAFVAIVPQRCIPK